MDVIGCRSIALPMPSSTATSPFCALPPAGPAHAKALRPSACADGRHDGPGASPTSS
jgi:hypothetical protein